MARTAKLMPCLGLIFLQDNILAVDGKNRDGLEFAQTFTRQQQRKGKDANFNILLYNKRNLYGFYNFVKEEGTG